MLGFQANNRVGRCKKEVRVLFQKSHAVLFSIMNKRDS